MASPQERSRLSRQDSTRDVWTIGHVTRDRIRIRDRVRQQPGGPAYYAALALRRLGGAPAVVTKTAAADRGDLLRELEAEGVDVAWRPSGATTTFENAYLDAALERRRQTVNAVADPFEASDLADVRGRLLMLGPLTVQDMPVAFLRAAAERGTVCLDAQGMVRQATRGAIASAPWAERDAGLATVGFLKVDDDEATLLSGETDPARAGSLLAGQLGCAPREAIVSFSGRGAVVCAAGQVHPIAAFPVPEPVDATGCGDTFFAAYLHRRLAGDDVPDAGAFAAATAALALTGFGPFTGSTRNVRALLEQRARR